MARNEESEQNHALEKKQAERYRKKKENVRARRVQIAVSYALYGQIKGQAIVYDKTGDGQLDMDDIAELLRSGENELTTLEGNGDFQSEECIELLKEIDFKSATAGSRIFRFTSASL